MNQINPLVMTLWLTAALALIGCTMTYELVLEEESESTLTLVGPPIPIRLHGGENGLTVPNFMPVIGGARLGPGAVIEVVIPPGTEIKFRDKVDIGGGNKQVAVGERGERSLWPVGAQSDPGRVLLAQPEPIATTSFSGTVWPGSTYTWILPHWFGEEAGAEVPVTGWVAAEVWNHVLEAHDDGSFNVGRSAFKSFAYQVIGPPAIWQAPFETPYGRVTGDGRIETVGGMTLEFSGNPASVSGTGMAGYTDPEGASWQYGFAASFPVELTSGDGIAAGTERVIGGANIY